MYLQISLFGREVLAVHTERTEAEQLYAEVGSIVLATSSDEPDEDVYDDEDDEEDDQLRLGFAFKGR